MLEHLTPQFDLAICIRLVSSVMLGFCVGLEREMTNKYAGLRTHILVSLGACVFTILSIYGFPMVSVTGDEFGTRDTARVAAQIVTGIGFIGGGTVLRHGATVYGLTTAATLWAVASIGMACGAGMFAVAMITTLACIIVLVSIRFFEKNVMVSSTKNISRLKISLTCANEVSNKIYDFILEKYPRLREISKKLSKQDENVTKINAIVDINSKNPIKSTYKVFQKVEGVDSISIQEYNEMVAK